MVTEKKYLDQAVISVIKEPTYRTGSDNIFYESHKHLAQIDYYMPNPETSISCS